MEFRDLAYATPERHAIVARLRDRPEHFVVEEVPAYTPSGAGEHLYLWIEKRSLTTPEAARRVAAALGADERTLGYAGLKDRHAVTRQWISVIGGAETEARARTVDVRDGEEYVRVLVVGRHGNRLKTGHLRGNRFRLVLAGTDDVDGVRVVLAGLADRGMPNYFGEQRFGRGGENLVRARRWLADERQAPRGKMQRRLVASTLQSDLFNRCLDRRLRAGGFGRILAGDLVQRLPVGALFLAEDAAALADDLRERTVAATGPLFGPRMRLPAGDPRADEDAVLAEAGLTVDDFRRFGRLARGGRRPYWIYPAEVGVERHADGVAVAFSLLAGAYATVVLREITKGEVSAALP